MKNFLQPFSNCTFMSFTSFSIFQLRITIHISEQDKNKRKRLIIVSPIVSLKIFIISIQKLKSLQFLFYILFQQFLYYVLYYLLSTIKYDIIFKFKKYNQIINDENEDHYNEDFVKTFWLMVVISIFRLHLKKSTVQY